ncbi:MAG: hypothetical protein INF52_02765 [Rhodobacter sp.]|nr:hypothetical protein [Rhodobacter sp.]
MTEKEEQAALVDKCWSLIFPGDTERHALIAQSGEIVHYTNHAVGVLEEPGFRLRNARKMKMDQTEVKFGKEVVEFFLKSKNPELRDALNSLHVGLLEHLLQVWTKEYDAHIDQTFISCFTSNSEASDGSAYHFEKFGRIAIFLNPEFMFKEPSLLGLYLVKVKYGRESILDGLKEFLKAIEANAGLLRRLEPGLLLSFLRHRLFFEAVASKHEEFAFEREWRLVHSPYIFSSAHIQPCLRMYEDKEEEVYLLKLEKPIGTSLYSLDVPYVIKRIIILPMAKIRPESKPDPYELRNKLVAQLTYRGLAEAARHVRVLNVSS